MFQRFHGENTMMKTTVRILRLIDNSIAWIEKTALAIGVLGMTSISIANVFMRNLAGHSLVFADELNQMLIIAVTFLGVGYAARQGRHIRMTAIFDQLGHGARKTMMILITLFTAALLFVLAWYSLDYVAHTRLMNSVTPALQIPLYLIYAVVPAGLTLGGVQYLLAAVRNIVEKDVYLSFTHKDEYEAAGEAVARKI